MAKCSVCDKAAHFGIQVSHSHRRSNKMWKSNIKKVKAVVNGTPKRIYVCTSCLRSVKLRELNLEEKKNHLVGSFFLHKCTI